MSALLVAGVPTDVTSSVQAAICRLFGTSCEPPPKGDPDAAYLPKRCEVYQKQEKAGYSTYIGIFKFGDEFAFMEQQMADGTYRMTLIPHNAEIGVEGKLFQLKGEGGSNFQLGGEAKIGAYLKGSVGDTWVFKDKAEADSFRDDIFENQAAMDAMSRNPGAGLYYAINPPPEIPDPQMTTATTRLEAGGNAELGLSAKDSKAEKYFDIGTGINGRAKVGGQVAVRTDNRRPDDPSYPLTATTYQLDGQLGAGSEVAGDGLENAGEWTGAVRITRNKQGEPVEIMYLTSVEESLVGKNRVGGKGDGAKGGYKGKDGESSLQESRTVIELKTPEERRIAEEYIDEQGLLGMPALAFNQVMDEGDALLTEPPPGAGEFEKLMYEKAWVSSIVQDKTSSQDTFGGRIALGAGLGMKVYTGSSEARTVESEYLGAPGDDGRRRFEEFPACLAEPG
ncbi:hypothetical protein [Murinocardiopsis flavida]|nr:hypothetical protein [Murinocardiopsis flavida]